MLSPSLIGVMLAVITRYSAQSFQRRRRRRPSSLSDLR